MSLSTDHQFDTSCCHHGISTDEPCQQCEDELLDALAFFDNVALQAKRSPKTGSQIFVRISEEGQIVGTRLQQLWKSVMAKQRGC